MNSSIEQKSKNTVETVLGFTGMFKGAIILAVFYTIFNSWLERRGRNSEIAT